MDLGADDYLTKPFQLLELRARVQAVIRRFYGRTNPLIGIGDLTIHPVSRKALWNGKEITLAAKEFDILEYIAEKHPAVVSSEEIVEHMYNEDFGPFSTVLRVHLSKLRKKLEDACGKNILVTTRGKGTRYAQKIEESGKNRHYYFHFFCFDYCRVCRDNVMVWNASKSNTKQS